MYQVIVPGLIAPFNPVTLIFKACPEPGTFSHSDAVVIPIIGSGVTDIVPVALTDPHPPVKGIL